MSASPGRLAMPRRRGTASGLLILLLGVWGAAIPFVGPYLDWVVGSDTAFDFTTSRLVMQLAPGAAAVVGGLLLMSAANRGSATFGAVLTIAGGAWFAVGPTLSVLGGVPDVGDPLGSGAQGALQMLTLFTGLGALLCVLGGAALARVTAPLAGDAQLLGASGAGTGTASDTEHRGPQRDRAIAPARREGAAPTEADTGSATRPEGSGAGTAAGAGAGTGAAAATRRDEDPAAADTRVAGRSAPASDDAPTLDRSADETQVLGDRTTDENRDTRVLGDRGADDQPPPPDASQRRG